MVATRNSAAITDTAGHRPALLLCRESTGGRGRRASLPEQRSEARARRRQGADVSALAAGPRPHATAPVGVAGSRAASSRPGPRSGIPGSRGLSSRSRHRPGSLRTTRHHRTRVQLTTRSSAAAADHSPGLRRLRLGYPTAEPGDVAAAAVCWSDLLAGAHSRTSSPAPSSRRTRRNRQVPEDDSLAPGMVSRGEARTARMHDLAATKPWCLLPCFASAVSGASSARA